WPTSRRWSRSNSRRRCGTWSGRARRRTTRSHRSALPASPWPAVSGTWAGASRGDAGRARRRCRVAGRSPHRCSPTPRPMARASGLTLDAEPVLYVERGGKGLLPLREPVDPDEPWLREALEALADEVRGGHVPRLGVERFDGEPVIGSPVGALLIELGFRQGPR